MLSPIAALESPYVRATHSVRRIAQAQLAEAVQPVYAHHALHEVKAVTPLVDAASIVPTKLDLLRDHYADDRMHLAVDKYATDEYQPPAQMQSACAGAGWGSVDCLLPTQAYRFAHANPPMEFVDTLVPITLRRFSVPGVQNIGLDEGFESARQRRQMAA
ncbi:hypothetical protein [Bordetella genomosp. 13]|uniref:Uncharacterized protein n=1 Tax=Bordetella genomosp. 13 TaxID=463040 RepID=A0A1W6ZC89_9BORD|nr:hypothetical protein [Bordetella genomosp. 13]ARP94971.1 hypothetical protein CAL15_11640 [Bordetella genomosp. 13]